MTDAHWPGVVDRDLLHPDFVAQADRLADAAKAGEWPTVLEVLEGRLGPGANQWRIGGESWFAPLHQAAWLGAPVAVVERLVALGGWRSLRTADGERPIDIARRRGHAHLQDALAVRAPGEDERRRFAAWDGHLAELIAARTRALGPVEFRPVATEVIAVDRLDELWFGYPGMYGGFSMSIHLGRLHVESWCRVAGGSGQAHIITEGGCVLVEEGFV